MSGTSIVLHQFRHSHFNEKARWGLDWKGIPQRRISHLPGPHLPRIRRPSRQTATPVLDLDGDCIAGSARILASLDARFPERPLHPRDPELRRKALQIQSEFDAEVGPAVRTALFSVLIDEPAHLCRIFAGERPLLTRLLVNPDPPDMRSPELVPARVQALHAGFREHPAARWVQDQYLRHRPAPCAVPA